MLGRFVTVVSTSLAILIAAAVLVLPPQGIPFAAATWVVLSVVFLMLTVEVPAFVRAAERGREPSLRDAARWLRLEMPIAWLVVSMLAGAVALAGLNVAGGASLMWLAAFALATGAAIVGATVEDAGGLPLPSHATGPAAAR